MSAQVVWEGKRFFSGRGAELQARRKVVEKTALIVPKRRKGGVRGKGRVSGRKVSSAFGECSGTRRDQGGPDGGKKRGSAWRASQEARQELKVASNPLAQGWHLAVC